MINFSKILSAKRILMPSLTTYSATGSDSATNSDTDLGIKKFSLKSISGDTHSLIISEDGTVYDYNETDDVWATRKGDEKFIFESEDLGDIGKTVNLDEVDVDTLKVISKDSTKLYSLDDNSTLTDYKIAKDITPSEDAPDENADKYVVAVIDDFETNLFVDDISDPSVDEIDIGLTHGDLVSDILESNNDDNNPDNDVSVLKYDLGSKMSYDDILAYLNDIQKRVQNGEDIDAINMSLGTAIMLDEVGLSDLNNLTDTERKNALDALSNEGYGDLVNIINKISELSNMGMDIYISAGNDADTQYDKNGTNVSATKGSDEVLYTKGKDADYDKYNQYGTDVNKDGVITSDELYNLYYESGYETNNDNQINDLDFYNLYANYDKNKDGLITGSELGLFNALTLASGKNVHVIGATDSYYDDDKTDGVAYYSNQNGLVDALYQGDVNINYVSYNSLTNEYNYDIDGDGHTDITLKNDFNPKNASNYGKTDYDLNGDGNDDAWGWDTDGDQDYDDYYSYDVNGDGVDDIFSSKLYDSVEQIKDLYKDDYLTTGTSFSSPLAAKLRNLELNA